MGQAIVDVSRFIKDDDVALELLAGLKRSPSLLLPDVPSSPIDKLALQPQTASMPCSTLASALSTAGESYGSDRRIEAAGMQ